MENREQNGKHIKDWISSDIALISEVRIHCVSKKNFQTGRQSEQTFDTRITLNSQCMKQTNYL